MVKGPETVNFEVPNESFTVILLITFDFERFRSSLENCTSNNTTQHEATRHNKRQHKCNTRQHEYNTTQHECNTTQHECNMRQHGYKTT